MLTVGDKFPDLHMKGVNETNDFIDVDVLLAEWSVIYFYPKDFTFICPTEIAAMDDLNNEADVIGVSGDNEFCELGIVNEEEGVCYRATFIVDPEGIIQHVSVNALDTGRNAEEVLRTLQALKAGGLTGCSWTPGDEFVA